MRSVNKYKVIDEIGSAIRIFYKKSDAIKFMQDGWSIELIKAPDRYQQALEKVGECLL